MKQQQYNNKRKRSLSSATAAALDDDDNEGENNHLLAHQDQLTALSSRREKKPRRSSSSVHDASAIDNGNDDEDDDFERELDAYQRQRQRQSLLTRPQPTDKKSLAINDEVSDLFSITTSSLVSIILIRLLDPVCCCHCLFTVECSPRETLRDLHLQRCSKPSSEEAHLVVGLHSSHVKVCVGHPSLPCLALT